MRKLAIWILVIILLAVSVNALGITPGRISLNFEPGAEHTVAVKVINSEKKAVDISITAEGELSKYVEITETRISFAENEEEKTITYKLKLPEVFDKPGLKEGKLVISQLPKNINGELVIGALVSVVSQLKVQVPYPDKYAEADFTVQAEKNLAKLHIVVKNLGEKKLENVKGTITITKDGIDISKKETNLGSTETYGKLEMLDIWYGDDGDYNAIATVNYDGKLIGFEREFSIGTLVNALGIAADKFTLGEIIELGVLIENGHSNNVKVNAKLLLKDEFGNIVADIESNALDLNSKKQNTAKLYWNTKDLAIGTYIGSLILNYNGKIVEKPVRIDVYIDRLDVKLESISGFAVANEQPARTDYGIWLPILFVLIVIMLILIIVTNIRLMKYARKNNE